MELLCHRYCDEIKEYMLEIEERFVLQINKIFLWKRQIFK